MPRRPLPPRRHYARRLLRSFAMSAGLIVFSLGVGTVGYHLLGDLGWIDSEYNAAMILTGMGPVNPMHTDAAKLFASAYALFSGVAFLTSAGVLLSPMMHRFLHRFHLEIEG